MFSSKFSSNLKFKDFKTQPDSLEFLNLCSIIPRVPKYSSASLVVFAEHPILAEMFLEDGRSSPSLISLSIKSFFIEFIAISRFEVSFLILV